MSQPKTTRDLVSEFMAGLAALIAFIAVLAATLGLGGWTAYQNGQKVQKMTQFCVEQGYEGWVSKDQSDDPSRCWGGKAGEEN